MTILSPFRDSLLHLFFPHVCPGCGSDALSSGSLLCLSCLEDLPDTGFHPCPDNPVEKLFWGRLPLVAATAQFYFTKGTLVQRLLHECKYRNNRRLCFFLGQRMGQALLQSHRFASVEALVPLPLHRGRLRRRGYNQTELLCEGMGSVLRQPVLTDLVYRTGNTESQTRKSRVQRWKNVEDRFALGNTGAAEGKHLLLVDDAVTTGATLEACGRCLLSLAGTRLSIAALCLSALR